MRLHDLKPFEGSRKAKKRLGRGVGSGQGKTAGRGTKGHRSRSGGGVRPGFEGGQMPIHRRLPKRGFTNIFKRKIIVVHLKDLERKFGADATINPSALTEAGLAKGSFDGIKVLGDGEITIPLTLDGILTSKGAQEKIEAAGGKVL